MQHPLYIPCSQQKQAIHKNCACRIHHVHPKQRASCSPSIHDGRSVQRATHVDTRRRPHVRRPSKIRPCASNRTRIDAFVPVPVEFHRMPLRLHPTLCVDTSHLHGAVCSARPCARGSPGAASTFSFVHERIVEIRTPACEACRVQERRRGARAMPKAHATAWTSWSTKEGSCSHRSASVQQRTSSKARSCGSGGKIHEDE